jgi:Uma2 family endonuclease
MATAAESSTRITAGDFLAMSAGDGSFELVRGEVVALSPGTPLHGRVCAKVAFPLEAFGRQTGHGYALTNSATVVTGRKPDTVRRADVAYYSHARLPSPTLTGTLLKVVPDLIVEVLERADRAANILGRVVEYLNVGVLMTWIVHPEKRTMAIFRPDDPIPTIYGDSDVIVNFSELPGFRCAVSGFFVGARGY